MGLSLVYRCLGVGGRALVFIEDNKRPSKDLCIWFEVTSARNCKQAGSGYGYYVWFVDDTRSEPFPRHHLFYCYTDPVYTWMTHDHSSVSMVDIACKLIPISIA